MLCASCGSGHSTEAKTSTVPAAAMVPSAPYWSAPTVTVTVREAVPEAPQVSKDRTGPAWEKPVLAAFAPSEGMTPAVERLRSGDELLARGDYAGALSMYQAAEHLERSGRAAAAVARATVMRKGIPFEYGIAPGNKALGTLAKNLSRFDSDPMAQLELGRLLLMLGDPERASEALEKSQQLLPSAEASSALGIAKLATGDGARAVSELKNAFSRARTTDNGFNLATAQFALGDTPEALALFEELAAILPQDAKVQNGLGTALLALGQPDRALAPLSRASSLQPKKATYRSNLGYAYQLKGERARAESFFLEATTLDPKLISAWVNLGVVRAQLQRFKEAREALEKAKKLDPEDPRVAEALSDLAELEKRAAAAAHPSP